MIASKGPIEDMGTRGKTYMPMKSGMPLKMIVSEGRRISFDPYSIENQAIRGFVHDEYYYNGYYKVANEKTAPTKVKNHTGIVGYAGYYGGIKSEGVKENASDWTSKCRAIPFALKSYGTGKVLTIENNGRTMTVNNPEPVTMVYNLVPGKARYYVTANGSSTKLDNGTIEVTGQERMIYLPHVGNTRDIGGWPVVDGNNVCVGNVMYNRVIRGAALMPPYDGTDITEDCRILADEVGVTMQIDIQNSLDGNIPRETVMDKSKVIFHNMHNESSDPSYRSPGLASYSTFFDADNDVEALKVYRWLAGHLSENDTNCAYVNCYSGKDRTGVAMATLLALCGCEEDSIIKDWELTNFWNWCAMAEYDKPTDRMAIDYTDSKGGRRKLSLWFKNLDTFAGNNYAEKAVSYLKSIGLSVSEINSLRSSLTKVDLFSLNQDFDIYCNAGGYGEYRYESGNAFLSRRNLMVDNYGKVVSKPGSGMCCTGYVNIDGFSSITVDNCAAGVVIAFYDINHTFKKYMSVSKNGSNTFANNGYAYAVINYPYDIPTTISVKK